MALRDWPIKQKLTAILLVISGLVLLLTSAAFVTSEVVRFRQTTLKNLSTLGRIIAANSTASLAFANEADAREILSALKAEPHVVAAGLYDKTGRLFARYPADLTPTALPSTPGPDGYRFEGGSLVGFAAVAQTGDARLGTLYLESDMNAVYDTIRLSGVIAAGVLALALVAAYVLAKLFQGRISEPILALADTAAAVSARQDYSVRAPKLGADELGALTDAFNQMLGRIEEQERALRAGKEELQHYATELEQRVAERTHELEERNDALRQNTAELLAANAELDAFAYSVSHDLRAPLRSIDGFSQVLLEDYGGHLDKAGQDSLQRVRAATQRMGMLIDDLLKLARITRAEKRTEPVDLSAMAREIVGELERAAPDRRVDVTIADGLKTSGDSRLLRVALDNLLRNSWKYTAKQAHPRIEFGALEENGTRTFMVRDNGAGFDMQYADKLFGVFQRLHSAAEFEGTGVGLATVRRIITRHGGRIWAEGAIDRGATFYFTL
ncbi:MAG TPA: ATP-binding protein [Gemmatimonadales bacterium]|jgi:signal transduction histidine kinase|nr:ATP-binding protein [Gemmatimonadales bacterium]